MDRDFILNIHPVKKTRNTAVIGHDLDGGYAVLASFALSFPAQESPPPRSIKVLLDCSGSMLGNSIMQARHAVMELLSHLRPGDYFNLFVFGNTCQAFFEKQAPVNSSTLTQVRRGLPNIAANMGGTEMKKALLKAISSPGPDLPQDILLITDGQVWAVDDLIQTARRSGHRVFSVGVGSAVSERLVRQIAAETGGACELVTPNEKMAEKIMRHFQRIYLPGARDIELYWPETPQKRIPRVLPRVFEGDTLHAFAFFAAKPNGNVHLKMTLANGQSFTQSVLLPDDVLENMRADNLPGTICRMGIQQSFQEQDPGNGKELDLKYQLISPWTNYMVTAERTAAEKELAGPCRPCVRRPRCWLPDGEEQAM